VGARLDTYQPLVAWATVIHLSHSDNGLGIKMKDLAHNVHHPESLASGFKLLWTRFSNGAMRRRPGRAVEYVLPPPPLPDEIHTLTHLYGFSSRPWSIFIIFYVFLIFVAGALPFILGRVVDITTRVEHQIHSFTEVPFWGDLSQSDIVAAESQLNGFTVSPSFNFLVSSLGTSSHRTQDYARTWTLASFTDISSLPSVVRMKFGNENVYFAELTQSQLQPNGRGLGTFLQNGTIPDEDESAVSIQGSASGGTMLMYVDRIQRETGNSCLGLRAAVHRVGGLGCIAKSSQNPRSICRRNRWSRGEYH